MTFFSGIKLDTQVHADQLSGYGMSLYSE